MLEKAKADPRTRQLIEERENAARNYASAIADAKFEGMEEGKAEGEKIGIEKGKAEERAKAYTEKIETAKRMLKRGLSIEDVADFSDLSIDEVLRLAN